MQQESLTLTGEEAGQWFDEYLEAVPENFLGPHTPFLSGTVIKGDLILTDRNGILEDEGLSLAGITVTGSFCFEDQLKLGDGLNLSGCEFGQLSLFDVQAGSHLNLRGTIVHGRLNLSGLEVGYIECEPWQLQALHYAAPTVSLVTSGTLSQRPEEGE